MKWIYDTSRGAQKTKKNAFRVRVYLIQTYREHFINWQYQLTAYINKSWAFALDPLYLNNYFKFGWGMDSPIVKTKFCSVKSKVQSILMGFCRTQRTSSITVALAKVIASSDSPTLMQGGWNPNYYYPKVTKQKLQWHLRRQAPKTKELIKLRYTIH